MRARVVKTWLGGLVVRIQCVVQPGRQAGVIWMYAGQRRDREGRRGRPEPEAEDDERRQHVADVVAVDRQPGERYEAAGERGARSPYRHAAWSYRAPFDDMAAIGAAAA